jgi:hypothetical protein
MPKPAAAVSPQVHFCGSIPLPSALAVFRRLATSLPPPLLSRIPDGETGARQDLAMFQRAAFAACPFVLRSDPVAALFGGAAPGPDTPPIKLMPLGYDDHALESYALFRELREAGVVPAGVRFQVSLPVPVNVLDVLVEPAWRAAVERVYEAALLAALRRIQDCIPAADLAIQWNVASVLHSWFAPVKKSLVRRVVRLAAAVDAGVALGFHLCYGESRHKYSVEPADMGLLVEVANAILKGVGAARPVDWLHLPVPKSRVDATYFGPLRLLEIGDAELYLGLIHTDDEEGTWRRIEAASEFVNEFGVAAECGLGMATEAELESILDIARKVTAQNA